jgi:hypothetical protein
VITVDRNLYEIRIECDGKKTALGCRVAGHVTGVSRLECQLELYRGGMAIGWLPDSVPVMPAARKSGRRGHLTRRLTRASVGPKYNIGLEKQ